MAFLIRCPNCGERSVYEFRFGGEVRQRPSPNSSKEDWIDYVYFRRNESGVQKEWWYHRLGCRRWFIATRDTQKNQVLETFWPDAEKIAQ